MQQLGHSRGGLASTSAPTDPRHLRHLQPLFSHQSCTGRYTHGQLRVLAATQKPFDGGRSFDEAKQRVSSFLNLDEQKLRSSAQQAAQSASTAAQGAAQNVYDSSRRTWMQLDSEHRLTEQAQRMARRAREGAEEFDQQYSVRRRIRNQLQTVRTQWPSWQKQLNSFSQTWYGKVVVLGALAFVLSAPFFWRAVQFMLLIWWLSIPASLLFMNYARQRASEAQEEQETAERMRQAEAAANPFASAFRNFAGAQSARGGRSSSGFGGGSNGFGAGSSGFGGRAAGGFGGAGRQQSSASRTQEGPIIDAEWESIDEGDSSSSRARRR